MKKNVFPKIKKEVKGFLMDESGKITKKDALKLAAGAVVLSAGIGNEANAVNTRCIPHSSSCSGSCNGSC